MEVNLLHIVPPGWTPVWLRTVAIWQLDFEHLYPVAMYHHSNTQIYILDCNPPYLCCRAGEIFREFSPGSAIWETVLWFGRELDHKSSCKDFLRSVEGQDQSLATTQLTVCPNLQRYILRVEVNELATWHRYPTCVLWHGSDRPCEVIYVWKYMYSVVIP